MCAPIDTAPISLGNDFRARQPPRTMGRVLDHDRIRSGSAVAAAAKRRELVEGSEARPAGGVSASQSAAANVNRNSQTSPTIICPGRHTLTALLAPEGRRMAAGGNAPGNRSPFPRSPGKGEGTRLAQSRPRPPAPLQDAAGFRTPTPRAAPRTAGLARCYPPRPFQGRTASTSPSCSTHTRRTGRFSRAAKRRRLEANVERPPHRQRPDLTTHHDRSTINPKQPVAITRSTVVHPPRRWLVFFAATGTVERQTSHRRGRLLQ